MQSQTFTKRTRLLLTIIAAAALSACGGGSGGPSTGDSSGGTGGGGSTGGGTNAASGTFIDNPVNGLEYEGGPSGTSGITGDNGTDGGFTVESGDTVTFSSGGLVLGTSDTVTGNSRIITPAELAGDPENFNNPVAIRIAQLLQSLDSDRDTSNGIDIPAAVITRLSDGTVNASTLRAAIDGDGDFEAVLGGVIDDLTAGGANRAEGEIVSASVAKAELAAAVAQATGGSAPGVTGGTPIVAAEVADCPAGVASTNRVDIFGQSFPICVLSSDITSNTTLTNDHVYVLESAINVGNGNRAGGPTQSAILTLEPGTQVFGYNGLQTGLVITRGSQIQAVGDADRPIIMAAVEASGTGNSVRITDDPTDLSKRGQWAGLVLSGSGINNQCSGGGATEVESEAVPTGQQRFFGCDDNSDSSGTVEYVIIAESGLGFRPDQEVQGLTIEAAGSGTRVNFLQVLGSEDDGIEWFGGATSVSNVVINGADDDSLDFDEGHVGTIQTALVIQGAENGDRGIEADNAGPDDDATPVTRPNFVNLTILGNQGSEDDTKGMLWRRGFGGEVFRGAILDNSAASSGTGQFKRGCLDIDDQIDTNTAFRDVAVGCANGTGPADAEGDGDGLETSFATGGADESGGAVSADRRDFTSINPATALNPNTLAVTVGEAPDNPASLPAAVNGFSANDWFGAVNPDSGNPDFDPTNNDSGNGPFWDGWTYINSGVDGNLPGDNFHPLEAELRDQIISEVQGTLIDAAVNGADYQSSGGSASGVTGASGTDGEFSVAEGDTVTFRLGDLVLGTSLPIEAGSIVTPAELAGDETDASNPQAIRIARLLQSLDSDSNTSNGIQIAAAVITRLSDGTVDTDALQAALDTGTNFVTIFGGMVDDLTAGNANRAEGDIVSAADAQAELEAAVAEDVGSSGSGGSSAFITPAATADCPAGVAATNTVTMFGKAFPVCVLSSDITDDTTLTNDHIYVLESAINVGDGNLAGGPTGSNNATLTLEAGTQIFGYNGLQTGLVITRGSRINAEGTADLPIIMGAVEASGTGTSVRITDDPADLTKRGQWAGLVLSGSGINNQCSGGGATEVESEAVPTGAQRFFGCSNNADSSGTVEYVIIAESGLGFRPDQEVQGLTIEAAGSGTRVNFLQVLGSEDDGIEWFGGATSVSNVVINGADDDSLDFDEGHVGTIQTALVIQGAENGDRGIEADNAGPDDDATPVTRPNFVNLTILGNQGSEDDTKGMLWRRGFGGEVFRGAVLDYEDAPAGTGLFKRGCLDIDDQIDTNTAFRDVAVGCANGTGPADAEGDGDGLETSFATGGADESGGAVSADRRDFTNIADPGAALNTTTLAVTVGEDPDNSASLPAAVNGFSANDWFGAVDPDSGNPDGNPNNNGSGGGPFWDGWTYINSGVDGGLPGSDFHPLQEEIQ